MNQQDFHTFKSTFQHINNKIRQTNQPTNQPTNQATKPKRTNFYKRLVEHHFSTKLRAVHYIIILVVFVCVECVCSGEMTVKLWRDGGCVEKVDDSVR